MLEYDTFCEQADTLKSMLDERERHNACALQARSFFRMTQPLYTDALRMNRSFEDHRCVVRPPPANPAEMLEDNSGFSGAFAGRGAFDLPTRPLGLGSFVLKSACALPQGLPARPPGQPQPQPRQVASASSMLGPFGAAL